MATSEAIWAAKIFTLWLDICKTAPRHRRFHLYQDLIPLSENLISKDIDNPIPPSLVTYEASGKWLDPTLYQAIVKIITEQTVEREDNIFGLDEAKIKSYIRLLSPIEQQDIATILLKHYYGNQSNSNCPRQHPS